MPRCTNGEKGLLLVLDDLDRLCRIDTPAVRGDQLGVEI